MNAVFPVSGVLTEVPQVGRQHTLFRIYIRGPFDQVQDSHRVHAPVNDWIETIDWHQFTRKRFRYVLRRNLHKTGRLRVDFYTGAGFFIEVGEGYVTSQVEFLADEGDRTQQGEVLGDIVLGEHNSYAEFWVPWQARTEGFTKGTVVHGGQTRIFARR